MTANELLTMPHNGYRYELVQGELRQMEFADRQHGRTAAQIGGCLGAFVATNIPSEYRQIEKDSCSSFGLV